MMGQETLHPLVSVVDFSKCKPMLHSLQRFGFYAVFLKDVKMRGYSLWSELL